MNNASMNILVWTSCCMCFWCFLCLSAEGRTLGVLGLRTLRGVVISFTGIGLYIPTSN